MVTHNPSTPGPGSMIGRVLAGKYLVLEMVAEGGMATVYRATRSDPPGEVAVKVMLPHLTRDRGFAARFKREAVITAKLSHPGMVRVLDFGAEQDAFFLVMEMLDGEDLFDVLRRKKRLEPNLARRIVADVCDALDHAHRQGIVHRDLKPENVFLVRASDSDLAVKVLDFGVAKMVMPEQRAGSAESEPVLTAMGSLLGTPEYISPEMCRGEVVGPAADLYACGVLLYALLTGKPPFVTENPIEVTMKHVGEEPVPPSKHVPGLDPALEAIILQALAKHPQKRQASAAALAQALRALGPVPPIPITLLGESKRARHSPEAATLALPPRPEDEAPKPAAPKPRAYAEPAPNALLTTMVVDPMPLPATGARPLPAPPPPAPPPPAAAAAPARIELATPAAAPAPTLAAPKQSPVTVRAIAPRKQLSPAMIALAIVVLAATFGAGFAAGRFTAPAPPHHAGHP